MNTTITPPPASPPEPDAWRRLMHRWFVQYNPLYLTSAALVLVGVVMLSRDLAPHGGPLVQLGITAIAELYAWALVGSAALLMRVGLRRPAVWLVLVAAFYQCDPTLHTLTSPLLGDLGVAASVAWWVSFAAKLCACAWAMRVVLSRSAIAVAMLGASGVAAMPWLFRVLPPAQMSALVGMWVFATLAAGLWTARRIYSVDALGPWPLQVARRSLRGIWWGWAGMMLAHVALWAGEHPRVLDIGVLLPAFALLLTRRFARESSVLITTAATLAATAFVRPDLLACASAMAAALLVLHALRRPTRERDLCESTVEHAFAPYRAAAPGDVPALHRELVFLPRERAPRLRLLVAALGCTYLAVWTFGYAGGPAPAHLWWLDALLVTAAAIWVLRGRSRVPIVLPIATSVHWIAQARIVPTPSSPTQWGALCVSLGFVLLAMSLVISVRGRNST